MQKPVQPIRPISWPRRTVEPRLHGEAAQVGVGRLEAAAVGDDDDVGAVGSHPRPGDDAIAAARMDVPVPFAMSMPSWKCAQPPPGGYHPNDEQP